MPGSIVGKRCLSCGKPANYGSVSAKYVCKQHHDELRVAHTYEELADKCKQLQAIIDRHDLCHNLGQVDVRSFADGCTQEQRKLFGCSPDADDVEWLRARVKEVITGVEEITGRLGRDMREHFAAKKVETESQRAGGASAAGPTGQSVYAAAPGPPGSDESCRGENNHAVASGDWGTEETMELAAALAKDSPRSHNSGAEQAQSGLTCYSADQLWAARMAADICRRRARAHQETIDHKREQGFSDPAIPDLRTRRGEALKCAAYIGSFFGLSLATMNESKSFPLPSAGPGSS